MKYGEKREFLSVLQLRSTKGGNNNLVSSTTEFLFHLTAGIEPCHAANALRSSAGLPSSRGDGDPAVNKMCSVSLYKVYSGVCTG